MNKKIKERKKQQLDNLVKLGRKAALSGFAFRRIFVLGLTRDNGRYIKIQLVMQKVIVVLSNRLAIIVQKGTAGNQRGAGQQALERQNKRGFRVRRSHRPARVRRGSSGTLKRSRSISSPA